MIYDFPTAANDFDFFFGDWRVRHRRLVRRLVGDTEWIEFAGTTSTRPILGGLGNFDENLIDLPQGRYQACTLRLFEPTIGQWSIRWIDGRDPRLGAALRGGFVGDQGVFLGDDHWEGRTIRVRFLWSKISAGRCRWEQAFSADGEASWETNWVMEFNRA